MRILRKILFVVFALLPLIPLIFYGINMVADGNTFDTVTLGVIEYDIIDDLMANPNNTLTATCNNLGALFNDYIPLSTPTIIAVHYLCYLFVVEMFLFVYDLLVFVPRKCSEIFSRG